MIKFRYYLSHYDRQAASQNAFGPSNEFDVYDQKRVKNTLVQRGGNHPAVIMSFRGVFCREIFTPVLTLATIEKISPRSSLK